MADSSTQTGSLFITLFILALLFSLISTGVINRNTAIGIDAYAKKSSKLGESGGGRGSGDVTRDHTDGNDKGGNDKGGNDKGGNDKGSSPSTKDKTPFVLSLPFP